MKHFRTILYFLIFISAFTVDRLTKIWAINNLMHKDIKLFKGLTLTLVWNRGVTWGFFSFKSLLGFVAVTAVIFLVLCFFIGHVSYLVQKGKTVFFEVLVLAGAASNLADRFLYKGVADFIDMHISIWHWPTYNLADVFVVIGVLGLLGRYFKHVYFRKIKSV